MSRIDASRTGPGPAPKTATSASVGPETAPPRVASDALALSSRSSAAPAEQDPGPLARAWGWVKDKASSAWSPAANAASEAWSSVAKRGTAAFFKLAFGAVTGPFKTQKVVLNPADANQLLVVNGKAPTGAAGAEYEAARKSLAADTAREQQALLALPLTTRQAYAKVAEAVAEQPAARRALQAMLLDGRLLEGARAKNGATALDGLVAMTAQQVVAPIDRKTMVAEVLLECEDPVRVNQHDRNTCGAATAQIVLLRSNPAEYVRIVSELAKDAGRTQLIGGEAVRREADWHTTHDGGRTNSSRLFQSAMMEIAGPRVWKVEPLNYDASEDKHKLGPFALFPGLLGGGLSFALSQVTGVEYDNRTLFPWSRQSGWNEVKQALSEGRGPVPAALTWGDSGHFVQVDRIANGVVEYTNPWGRRETMSEAEFLSHLTQVQLRQAR